jgi:hypothetical protein
MGIDGKVEMLQDGAPDEDGYRDGGSGVYDIKLTISYVRYRIRGV